MKYGVNFRVIGQDGLPVVDVRDAFPHLKPFVYKDGTGELGWALTRDFCFDFRRAGDKRAWRVRVKGDPEGNITLCFDYDGASRPNATRVIAGDRMDKDVIVGSFIHDLGFCIHEYIMGFERSDWNGILTDVMDAYGATEKKQLEFHLAVMFGGRSYWPKTDAELAHYRSLVAIEEVPVW